MSHEQRDRHAEGCAASAWDGGDVSILAAILVALEMGGVSMEEGMTIVDWMALVLAVLVVVSIIIVWRNL